MVSCKILNPTTFKTYPDEDNRLDFTFSVFFNCVKMNQATSYWQKLSLMDKKGT